MKLWVIEYKTHVGWRPIIPLGVRTKREAEYRLRERQKLEPDGEFRIAKYVREEERWRGKRWKQ